MYEQDEIYDGPEDHRQQQKMTIQRQNKLKVKQKIIEAFIILSQPSPTKQSLSQCHKILAHYLIRCDILQIFFELVEQFNSQNETLTKLIITQIFTYIKKQLSFGYEGKHDKFIMTQVFLKFFINSNVDYKFKKMIQNTFTQFIYDNRNDTKRRVVINYLSDKLTKILASTQKSFTQLQNYNKLSSPIDIFIPSSDIATEENIKMALTLIPLLQSLFLGGNLQTQLISMILPNCISIYYLMTQTVTKNILIAVSSKQQAVFAQKIDECSKFIEIFIILFSKTDTGKFPTLRERFLHTREIFNLLLVLLTISPQFTSFDAVQKVFSQKFTFQTGQISNLENVSFKLKELISSLNFKQNFLSESLLVENLQVSNTKIISNLISIKKHSIQILIKCIKSLQKKKKQFTGQYPYLTASIVNLWLQVKDCLIKGTQKYLKQLQGMQKGQSQIPPIRKQYQDLLGSSIKYLSEVTNLSPLYNIVSPYQNEIIFQICFPWLISRQQHEKFQAEDYLFFREDVINKQNMSYIENYVGNLLESYLDNIDGAITLIMSKCTALISYHITKNTQIKQTLINEMQNCWALQFYSPQRQIQSALTLIAVESYLSLRRNDIALLLQKWLQQHKAFFLNVNNDYRITIQFLMMYSYYVDNFYSNSIRGISSQYFEFRSLHKEVLKFCCYLMKENYDYQKNTYKGKLGQILYCSALDCLNNSLNHTQIVPALYYNFPPKEELSIPNYMLPYENYPFYPVKRVRQTSRKNQIQMDIYNGNKKDLQEQDNLKQILVHYRKLGLNRDQYIQKEDLIEIIEFLGSNLSTRGNIKIIQILTQMLINYIKQEMKHQGSLVNIPIIFREEIATLLVSRIYGLLGNKNEKFFPNRNLFQTKAIQLIYVLHSISIDPYFIYSMGMDVLWLNPDLWNFHPDEDDNNIDSLLKCTDLIIRLALKHYTSQKSVNLNELLNKITQNLVLYSYQYIVKIHKFNILFGILLNLILLKINPQKMLEFLYLLITQKLMKAQLSEEQFDHQSQERYSIPSSSASDLLSQAFYLFLLNIYVSPIPLNTEKNIKLLTVFTEYLTNFLNAHKIVTQLGDVFGKVFAISLCIIEREYLNGSLCSVDKNMLEFLWRNTLYSGKIYRTELQNRVVSIKLLNLIRQIIKRNDPEFSLERVQLMYQISCSCVFYSKNKDLLMSHDEQGPDQDFDHDGEQEEWQNIPITMKRNESEIYIEDQVLILKKTSRELLESSNPQIKQWISKLIESLPIAVRNFLKNKVINYEQEAKEIGLRKIIKVKRPGNEGLGGLTKQQIIKENIEMRKEKQGSEQDHIQI